MQVPRGDNSVADQCANQALDTGDFRETADDEMLSLLDAMSTQISGVEYGLLVSFDGASRGNPGAAAAGVGIWWGQWHPQEFREQGCLLRLGRRLGDGTNNYAEAKGMALGIKAVLQCLLRTVTFLSDAFER